MRQQYSSQRTLLSPSNLAASTLDKIIVGYAEGKLTFEQYQAALTAEIHLGHILWTGNRSHEVQLTGAPHPRTARASPSISSACAEMTDFITSPIETIPIIFVPSRTGRWRTRFSVITRIQSAIVSLGLAVNTSRVMISLTGVSFEDNPFRITFRV